MLKRRINKIEKHIKAALPQNKKLKTWTVVIDETKPEIKDPNEEANRLIEKVKAGHVKHKDGSYYSEEDANFFLIRIITDKREFIEEFGNNQKIEEKNRAGIPA